MKALILNSGLGSRMGVLTSEQPKCLTEIYGTETILGRQLRQITDAGIDEVIITTGYNAEAIENYCDSLDLPIKIKFVNNPCYRETNYIYSIYCAKDYLDDDIIMMHGDLVFENRVFDVLLESKGSNMIVSSTALLPEKDFKAVVIEDRIQKVGIEFFDNAVAAQPLYYIQRHDWNVWLKEISDFCGKGQTKCYAENAFNECSEECFIKPCDVKDFLCKEIDTPEDLESVKTLLRDVEQRTVYMCFSAEIIHSGHMKLIKKARKYGRLIIGVLSDEAIASYKRYPIVPFSERCEMFRNIVGVWKVVRQDQLSYRENLLELKPDFVIHGDDWKYGFQRSVRQEVIDIVSAYGAELIEYPYTQEVGLEELDSYSKNEITLPDKRGGIQKSYIIQKVYTPKDEYVELDNYLYSIKAKKIFLVCGSSFQYYDSLRKHIEVLNKNGIEFVRFDRFHSNPDYESVVEGVNLFLKEACDTIFAVGGGSAIDVAKCIKLFHNMKPTDNYLNQTIVPNTVPIIVMPTTAGSGSEATRFAVIYYHGEKQSVTHDSCIPDAVLLDASVLKTLPIYQKKSTLLDSLCHAMEACWSLNSTVESMEYSKASIRQIMQNIDGYLAGEQTACENMLNASHTAGKAINIAQTTAGHAMSYKLTVLYHIAHGHAVALSNAVVIPHLISNLNRCVDEKRKKSLCSALDLLRQAFDLNDMKDLSKVLPDLIKKFELPVDVVEEKDLVLLKRSVNQKRLRNHPVIMEQDEFEVLYRQIKDI